MARCLRLTAVALAATSLSAASQASLDCPLRQIGLDYAQTLQPFRPLSAFQAVADALNGAPEAQHCSVAPSSAILPLWGQPAGDAQSQPAANLEIAAFRSGESRVLSFPLPALDSTITIYVDPVGGSDSRGNGSIGSPFLTLQHALAVVREIRRPFAASRLRPAARPQAVPPATIVLRAGTFYLGASGPLELGPADSNTVFQSYPGEEAVISGGVPLSGISWQPATPPHRSPYEYRAGVLAEGFDVAPGGSYTLQEAQALCTSIPACAGFSYDSANPAPPGAVSVAFKYAVFYARGAGSSVYVKNAGYVPGAVPALYAANVSGVKGLGADVAGLRVNGLRSIRARYPNAGTAEQLGAMQIIADAWTPQPFGTEANYTFNPPSPSRNDSADGYFQTFRLGVGGPCAVRFTPQASYWCAEGTQGGGPGPYQAPVGMSVSSDNASLPHTPYASNVSRAVVHTWRAGRWFSWAFLVDGQSYNPSTRETTFNFSVAVGGNQGSRGGNAGQEFMIENVLEELDAPGEFYYDPASTTLYLWANGTSGASSADAPSAAGSGAAAPAPPEDDSVVVAALPLLINATGTQANPVVGLQFLGITFRDTAPNYLGPHGTPSGGDWAVERSAALFIEGSERAVVDGCLFTTLDGNALFLSGFTRSALITRNEFYSIGETAVSQWGYTDGSPVAGMGFDATAGNIPIGTAVTLNLAHEVGIWTKQNSFYFQSASYGTLIQGNIAFNGPRAGINFDDGMGGGSAVLRNVLFNFCRESSDHGPFNSWNRQVYLVTGADGQPTTSKQNDTIAYNWILANYHSSMAIDNDDGSAYFDTHHNVLIAAASDAAWGGNSLKADFGGHDNFHHANLDLFWSVGFGIVPTQAGHADGYYDNVLYIAADGDYGNGQTCSGPGMTIVSNNTVYSPTGAINECGTSLAAWQAAGNDPGTRGLPYPEDETILGVARNLLGL